MWHSCSECGMQVYLLIIAILLSWLLGTTAHLLQTEASISRCSFPNDFIFGVSSSALQYEGAASEDGRGPSVWDTFAHTPGMIKDGSNADVSLDEYHRFEEDILLMKNMGLDSYRFSISWTRIFPDGNVSRLNSKGIEHYNALIDALLEKGIQPFVTLYHYDLPQPYEDSFKGWLGGEIVDKFRTFAEVCFEAFGDRVKSWITINEPQGFIRYGYCKAEYPPARVSRTEPYVAGHNVLLAHAAAVQVYRKKFQAKQGGKIGIALNFQWSEPFSETQDDQAAAEREIQFELGWFLAPLVYGDYPLIMRQLVGEHLPVFTDEQAVIVINSYDFIGVNHYTAHYVQSYSPSNVTSCIDDHQTLRTDYREGVPIGEPASSWEYVVPWGFRKALNFIKDNYNNPSMFITENGYQDSSRSLDVSLRDPGRISYYKQYLLSLLDAISLDGVNVSGYYAWSLLDNWEWNSGYTSKFGLYFVDYDDGLKRYAKDSARWFKNFLSVCQQETS